jgi:hypothetical protein
LVRQLKEALKAKAGAALLEAARAGSSFLIPKLLDTGEHAVMNGFVALP